MASILDVPMNNMQAAQSALLGYASVQGNQYAPTKQVSLTTILADVKLLHERIQASATQALSSADNLIGGPQIGQSGQSLADSQPSGLIDQLSNALQQANAQMDRLGSALDRIDRAHG